MPDIDTDRVRRNVMSDQEAARAADEIDALRTRLAEVECERDRWIESARRFCQNADYWRGRFESEEARLAAVLALCDDLCTCDFEREDHYSQCDACKVRAAARGQDDHG